MGRSVTCDQGGRDDGEHHLVAGEEDARHGAGAARHGVPNGGAPVHVVEEGVGSGAADDAMSIVLSKGEGEADDAPDDRGDAHGDEALHDRNCDDAGGGGNSSVQG